MTFGGGGRLSPRGWLVLAGAGAMLAFFTRSAGLPLVLALSVALLLARRFRAASVFAVCLAIPGDVVAVQASRGRRRGVPVRILDGKSVRASVGDGDMDGASLAGVGESPTLRGRGSAWRVVVRGHRGGPGGVWDPTGGIRCVGLVGEGPASSGDAGAFVPSLPGPHPHLARGLVGGPIHPSLSIPSSSCTPGNRSRAQRDHLAGWDP